MTQTVAELPKIVLTGSLAVDQILHYDGSFADQLAGTDLKNLSLSVILSGFEKTQGGVAGNIAYSLALLGEKPLLYASIGQDQLGYLEKLAKLGVDTSLTHLSNLPTASFTVLTDKNSCQIGGFYPGAMSEASSLTLKPFVGQSALIVVSAHDPAQMAVQLQEAVDLKLRLVFDLGQQVAALEPEVIKLGLQAAEVLLVNKFELDLLTKKTGLTAAEIFELVPIVIVTLGANGCRIHQLQADLLAIPAVTAQVVDPTGAGDAFRAGFLYGYIRLWTLEKSAQLGATLAAIAVESHGTQLHQFTKLDLANRYQNQYHQLLTWD